MVLGQEPKIYLFLGVYSAEDIFRLCAALCFSYSSAMGVKRTCIVSKNPEADWQTTRLYSCILCRLPRSNTGFFGDLVQRGFLKAVSKKFRISSLNDPIIQGVISIGHVFTSLNHDNSIINNGVIIT